MAQAPAPPQATSPRKRRDKLRPCPLAHGAEPSTLRALAPRFALSRSPSPRDRSTLGVALVAEDAAGQKSVPARRREAEAEGRCARRRRSLRPRQHRGDQPVHGNGGQGHREVQREGLSRARSTSSRRRSSSIRGSRSARTFSARRISRPRTSAEAEAAFKTAEDLNDAEAAAGPLARPLRARRLLRAREEVGAGAHGVAGLQRARREARSRRRRASPVGRRAHQGHRRRAEARQAYEIVRQRIAAEKADAGAPADAGKPAAPAEEVTSFALV